jgi:uncharacterized membrane-anchored protein
VLARLRGTEITLRTVPVDPFDVLAGRYVTLSYAIELEATKHVSPGFRPGQLVWLTVERGDPAWTLVSVTADRPARASGQVSLRARWDRWRVSIEDASRLYVTEEVGREVDARPRTQADLIDLRVGEDGTPAVMRLRGPGIDLRAE